MFFSIRKIFAITIFNICIFLFLLIGIQNSSNKSKVYFFSKETIELPVSFIVGSSFIFGSFFGLAIPTTKNHKKKDFLE